MMFNGVPGIIANLKKDADCTNKLEFLGPAERKLRVTATGTPSGVGGTVECFDSKEEAKSADYTDPNNSKKTIRQKNWWIEDKKQLICELQWFEEGITMMQTRSMLNDDTIVLDNVMTKKDGTSSNFVTTFKRMKP
jgi:hypothetical protein